MEFTEITFKNIFKEGDVKIYCPNRSVEILNVLKEACTDIYNGINKKFQNDGTILKFSELFPSLKNENFGWYSRVCNIYRTCSEIKNIYSSDDFKNYIKKAIEEGKRKNSSENFDVWASYIPYYIILFSIFEYEEDKMIDNLLKTQDFSNIYYKKIEGQNYFAIIDDVTNNYYLKIKYLINNTWKDELPNSYVDPAIVNGLENTYSVITKGCFSNNEGFWNNIYDINKYIRYSILYPSELLNVIFESEETACLGLATSQRFPAEFLYNAIDKIIYDNLKRDEFKGKIKSGLTQKTFDFSGSKITVSFTNEVFFTEYYKLYNYALGLLREYVAKKRNEKKSDYNTVNKIFNDDYVKRLCNFIVKCDCSDNIVNFKSGEKYTKFLPYGSTGKTYIEGETKKTEIGGWLCVYFNGPTKYSSNLKEIQINSESINFSDPNITVEQKNKDDVGKITDNWPSYYFFETLPQITDYNGNIENKINMLCSSSGTLASKLTLFTFYDFYKKKESTLSNDPLESRTESAGVNLYRVETNYKYSLEKRLKTDESNSAIINGINYNYDEFYNEVSKIFAQAINDVLKDIKTSVVNTENTERILSSQKNFDDYLQARLSGGNSCTEKDFFFLKTKNGGENRVFPNNTFVDVQFAVPAINENGTIESKWIPVTSVRFNDREDYFNFTINSIDTVLHAGNYFESFELEDKAEGAKEISLTLKSANDINLERIIHSSLSLESKLKEVKGNKENVGFLMKVLEDTNSNFRIRFGYRDRPFNSDDAIACTEVSDDGFINRVHEKKPVLEYPWTYFKIIGIESDIKNGEDTYNIKGVNSSYYILNNLALSGVNINFGSNTDETKGDATFLGRPKNVLGKISEWISKASCAGGSDKFEDDAKICFLGDNGQSIVYGYSDYGDVVSEYNYELKGGKHLKGGNIQSVENYFFEPYKNGEALLEAKKFNIDSSFKTMNIKKILDELVNWLPQRVYYIAKMNDNQGTAAVYLPYEEIYKIKNFFSTCPYKAEKMKYQVIEAYGRIYKGDIPKGEYRKIYFIRLYYEGPGCVLNYNGEKEASEDSTLLRVYTYRATKDQVIEDIDLTSENEFANVTSSVTILGGGKPIVFSYDMENGTMNETMSLFEDISQSSEDVDINSNSELNNWITFNAPKENPKFILDNSKYILSNIDNNSDNVSANLSQNISAASLFFSDLQNKLYTGTMTITGDPFYYFDSSLEAGKYEIYLRMNRVSDPKTYSMEPSYYSGIYFLTGIKHNISSDGKYTTTLELKKRIFGTKKSSS